MPPSAALVEGAPARQRKAHRKSRLGCANCKLRSVKCDEAKPACLRCSASGFTCTYSGSGPGSESVPELHLAHARVFRMDPGPGGGGGAVSALLLPPAPAPQRRVPALLPVAGRPGGYEMQPADFAALDRFKSRTVWTFGTASMRSWYSDGALGLSNSNPFLLHIFLAVSLLHDTHTAPSVPPSHHALLAFHLYHGTALFHRQLARPSPATTLSSSARDALWVSAAMLGAAAFARLDTLDPWAAWPLKAPDPSDLDWFKMGHGKKIVWEIADPQRPDSVFNRLTKDMAHNPPPDGKAPIREGALHPLFRSVFDLSSASSAAANPYHIPLSLIAQLLPEQINGNTVHRFFTFLSQIEPPYQRLVEQKDPRALLLLAYWHAKLVPHPSWWIRRRSVVEGLAICIYLDRECADEPDLLQLLEFPRGVFTEMYQSGDLDGAKALANMPIE